MEWAKKKWNENGNNKSIQIESENNEKGNKKTTEKEKLNMKMKNNNFLREKINKKKMKIIKVNYKNFYKNTMLV